MKKGEIKAFVFDMNGVLVINRKHILRKTRKQFASPGVHRYVASKLKISLDQYFDAIETAYAKSIEGKIPEKQLYKIITKNLKTSRKNLIRLYKIGFRRKYYQNKRLYRLAFKLKKEGYKISILSDQWPASKEALALPKYLKKFDKVVISCDVGLRKPNPRIYKLALRQLKLKPKP